MWVLVAVVWCAARGKAAAVEMEIGGGVPSDERFAPVIGSLAPHTRTPESAVSSSMRRNDFRLYREKGGEYFGIGPVSNMLRKATSEERARLLEYLGGVLTGLPADKYDPVLRNTDLWLGLDGDFYLVGPVRHELLNRSARLWILTPLELEYDQSGRFGWRDAARFVDFRDKDWPEAYNRAMLKFLLDDPFGHDNSIPLD